MRVGRPGWSTVIESREFAARYWVSPETLPRILRINQARRGTEEQIEARESREMP